MRRQVDNGPHMTWQEGHVWTAEVSLPAGAELEFKVRDLTRGCCSSGHVASRQGRLPDGGSSWSGRCLQVVPGVRPETYHKAKSLV